MRAKGYPTHNGRITGKRREAWRDGIEELWRHLGRVAEKIGGVGLAQIHREGPARLVKRKHGRADLVQADLHSGTPGELMKMHLEVLEAVAEAMAR
jgi:hypothetical protein